MKNQLFSCLAFVALSVLVASCGKSKSAGKSTPNNGQLVGATYSAKMNNKTHLGMVHIPQGTFHMGPSDEDMNYSYTARNRQMSISGFWMDITEITNKEYKQFVYAVRDSVAATTLGYIDPKTNNLDQKKMAGIWKEKNINEKLGAMMMAPDDRINGRMEIDPDKLIYQEEYVDYKAAAYRKPNEPRSKFIIKNPVKIYPDTLVWVRDFSYSYNEPMSQRYFAHPAFQNYPVVGVTWKQASAFCTWRSRLLNSYNDSKNYANESNYRLPTEAEWEYAARGGRSQSMFPWGNYYLRNRKGCLMANFKPGRGNYPEDGGFYTVRADAYWPNDFGLYNMAGNVAEWTSSLYYEGGYNFAHDMNPDIRYNAKDSDPPRMKRKVVRGGSWQSVGYYLQTSTRNYEYQDTAKSYIGFRCVIDLAPGVGMKRGRK
ncbi:MAG: SUMF1/EgtB/PvdO family nonheme iron enzyme [Chitinophagaceae bacterium]|nr:SUMF1/EgtB/PvdO family nonheme iron enzyme [Chitinophagaceae bacterium]